ncbi:MULTISPECIES: DUF2993 domain-containing protein [unclassified Streptomyces]|uniref:LmeA family phospholipid-binding protein n=1 Tax=unclassified Streptomyces TaxID=2593676 RepID=UPI002E193F6B|nr:MULTISPECIES: DUF2993 domain-containing protein [unclassified Streptomyces]
MIENGPPTDSTAHIPDQAAAPGDYDAPLDRKARKARRRAARRVLRSPARTAVKLTATLVVVLAFLALGDRWAVLYAENMAAEKVQESLKLHAEPEVHINSFPFLGQVAMGNIDNVEVNVPHVPAGPVSVAQVTTCG